MKNIGNLLNGAKSVAILIAAVVFSSSIMAKNSVDYPTDYRSWFHVKSMVILPGHALANPFEGIHHVYVNDLALSGLKSGDYQDGSVLVFDLLKYTESNAAFSEGERKLVGVMSKDNSLFKSTGGWGFEAFGSNSKTKRLTTDGGTSCFQCHTQKEKQGFVFSALRD